MKKVAFVGAFFFFLKDGKRGKERGGLGAG